MARMSLLGSALPKLVVQFAKSGSPRMGDSLSDYLSFTYLTGQKEERNQLNRIELLGGRRVA